MRQPTASTGRARARPRCLRPQLKRDPLGLMPDSRALSVRGALRPLIDKLMWDAGWAGDIAWFQFGPRFTAWDRQGRSREVGEYALHISCAWIWKTETGYVRADEDSPDLSALGALSALVETVGADASGGLELRFSNGDCLRVDADATVEGSGEEVEFWRLLQPGRQTPHVVSSNVGVQWHEA